MRLEQQEELVFTEQISEEEFFDVLTRMAKDKAPGVSQISTDMLLSIPYQIRKWIVMNVNNWISIGQIPHNLLKSQIWLIPKGVYDEDPKNTRSINLIESIRKILSSILVS